jgi:putative ABC transport system ATP-binding protein
MRRSPSPTIVLEGAGKRYGNTRAFGNLTLTIAPGEFVAIVGRSGAGKTTLLRSLASATTVTEGRILVGETDLARLHGAALRDHRRRVGMIYQQFNLVKRLRVADNVLVGRLAHTRGLWSGLALARIFSADDRGLALRCLAHVGLLDRAWQRTDTLSGGEQQRVAIARAVVGQRRLLLADEPTGALDSLTGEAVVRLLRRQCDNGCAAVLVTHDARLAAWADRVVFLRDGRMVDQTAANEELDRPSVPGGLT